MQLKATTIKNKWQRSSKCKTKAPTMTMVELLNSSKLMSSTSKCLTRGLLSQGPIPCLDSKSTISMTLVTSPLNNLTPIMLMIKCRWTRDKI